MTRLMRELFILAATLLSVAGCKNANNNALPDFYRSSAAIGCEAGFRKDSCLQNLNQESNISQICFGKTYHDNVAEDAILLKGAGSNYCGVIQDQAAIELAGCTKAISTTLAGDNFEFRSCLKGNDVFYVEGATSTGQDFHAIHIN